MRVMLYSVCEETVQQMFMVVIVVSGYASSYVK